MPQLQLVVTLGDVIQTVAFIGGLMLAYGALRERLVRIETQLNPIAQWWNNRAASDRSRRVGDAG